MSYIPSRLIFKEKMQNCQRAQNDQTINHVPPNSQQLLGISRLMNVNAVTQLKVGALMIFKENQG